MTTASKIEIFYSPWRMLSLLTGAAGFVVMGYLLVAGDIGGASSLKSLIGFASIIFFGGVSVIILKRWFTTKEAVVTITQTGITDIRIAAEEIPWVAISNLAIWQQGRQKSLVLSVDPQVETKLTLTRLARWTREPNKALGVDGLCVAANGLKMKFEPLAELIAQRWRARPDGASIA